MLPDLVEGPESADPGGPAGVVSHMNHHGFQCLPLDPQIAGASKVQTKLGVTAGCAEHGAGDERPLLGGQLRTLPDVAEEMAHGVVGHGPPQGAIAGRALEEAAGQGSTGVDPILVGRGF